MSPGSKYVTIKGVVEALNGGEPVDLEHKEGEVWFIYIWNSWSGKCQPPMKKLSKMLKNNKHGDKLKVIAIGMDETSEEIKKNVEAKVLT